MVRWRWSRLLISQTAERILSLMNCCASDCRPLAAHVLQHAAVGAADPQPRQAVVVELDDVLVAHLDDEHVGLDVVRRARSRTCGRAGSRALRISSTAGSSSRSSTPSFLATAGNWRRRKRSQARATMRRARASPQLARRRAGAAGSPGGRGRRCPAGRSCRKRERLLDVSSVQGSRAVAVGHRAGSPRSSRPGSRRGRGCR